MHTDKCPICDSTEWEYTDTKIVDDMLIEECLCPKCDSTWTELWAFVENRNIVDARIKA